MSGAAPQADHSPDPDEHPAAGDLGVWRRIREHKIIQWALGYLAAALALTHAEELIAHAYGWPESIGQILIAVLGIGLPVSVTLAWYHGHRASRHVSGAEASILAVLLLIGSGLLWALVRPHEPALTQSVAEHAAAPTTPPVSPAAVPVTPASTAPLVPPPASGNLRIAILPFENLSPDPANAFFTDGLHEEIISTLSSRAPDLEVISRTTMMTYRTPKHVQENVQEIARELGATHVLEGSVRREGNAVRLTLQLIDARRDQHVWSHDYPGTLKSALTLQSEVANEVASQLAVQLASGANAFRPITRDPQAYDLYLKAKLEIADSIRGPPTPLEALQRIEGLLSDALARDPDFARAYAQRAAVYLVKFAYNYDTPQHLMPLAQKDLMAAERLAPNDSQIAATKAAYLDIGELNTAGAVAILDAAGTEGLDAFLLAVTSETYARAGRFDAAIQRTQRAMVLDPKNQLVYTEAIFALLDTRRTAEALRVANLAAAEFPDDFRPVQAAILWGETGIGSPGAAWGLAPVTEITANSDLRSLTGILVPLRFEHRYREIADFLTRAKTNTIRGEIALGRYPVAELRGWTHLLLGDRAAAAQDGRQVLDFVAHAEETKWNRAFLTLLTSEGHAFAGDRAAAITAAGKALQGQPTLSLSFARGVASSVAAVYAWSGAPDEAASLLERISTEIPAGFDMVPAAIARDPLYTVPLTGNARYQALRAKLEAQMAATKLE